jgi:hypothetical protein
LGVGFIFTRNHAPSRTTWTLETLLALMHARGPSIVQVRGRNVLPDAIGGMVGRVRTEHAAAPPSVPVHEILG